MPGRRWTLALLCLFVIARARPWATTPLDEHVRQALHFAEAQVKKSVATIPDPALLVRSTRADGSWNTVPPSDWTSGFFPGLLWYLSESSRDRRFRQWAVDRTASLAAQQYNTGDHDVGLRIWCSYGHGYRLTHHPAYHRVLLTAAGALASRFHPVVGGLRSWDFGPWTFPVIIDNLMNLELLFWASKHGGDPAWYDLALQHARTTMRDHVRPDGSSFQVVDYDPSTGAVLHKQTYQGYQDASTWARGQAWGIYGFTMAYRETGESRFLATAEHLAQYFISRLPADHIPYWDFQAPQIPHEPRDSSAAAIAASGLLELSTHVPTTAAQQHYRAAALAMLASLCSAQYLARGTHLSAILQHATGSKPSADEVDVGLIYGDYYFVEALLRYKDAKRIPSLTPPPRALHR